MYAPHETSVTDPPIMLVWKRDGSMTRSADGRFDIFFSDAHRQWVVIDWNKGIKVRGESVAACKNWCANRTGM